MTTPATPSPPDWPRIRDLPVEEQEKFKIWLWGHTVPMLDHVPWDEQDAYYPWDYRFWKAGWLRP